MAHATNNRAKTNQPANNTATPTVKNSSANTLNIGALTNNTSIGNSPAVNNNKKKNAKNLVTFIIYLYI